MNGDAASQEVRDELPPYNVYGADGDVTAELVYVNQGMPDDNNEYMGGGRAGTERLQCAFGRSLRRVLSIRRNRLEVPHCSRSRVS